jgi:hypothetical protein
MIQQQQQNKKNDKGIITYDDLMQLWDELTIVPDSISLRLVNLSDGIHYRLARAKTNIRLGPLSDEIDLFLTEPLTTREMYNHLNKMWLDAFTEE